MTITEPATSGSNPAARQGQSAELAALVERHHGLLTRAMNASRERSAWAAHPDHPRGYGDPEQAKAEFEGLLGRPFDLGQAADDGHTVGAERSPYGFDLAIGYPALDPARGVARAERAMRPWQDVSALGRAAVCAEILSRLNADSQAMAQAVMHTSGQGWLMAFQAGGPHAQDRALEAVAVALAQLLLVPGEAEWIKPTRNGAAHLHNTYRAVPRGVAVVIGCRTFPTWNSYPGLFASLVTGNAVIVKPHPNAILPLAITVRVARQVLGEVGLDPDLVQLAAEDPDGTLALDLAGEERVRIIDFTGSARVGDLVESRAPQARVYAEKSGVNVVIVDSTSDFVGMCRNLALSLTLYSGQMCTTPQTLLIPADGIPTDQGRLTFDEVCAGIADAVETLVSDPVRAVEVTGALSDRRILGSIQAAAGHGRPVLASRPLTHPRFGEALIRTPMIRAVSAQDREVFAQEVFGPVSFAVATGGTVQSLEIFESVVGSQGALTAAVYSSDDDVVDRAFAAATRVGVSMSANLTGPILMNQTAAFTDYHGTGANPAATASYCDAAFVTDRFRIVQLRRPVEREHP